jgi:hypothetical protein
MDWRFASRFLFPAEAAHPGRKADRNTFPAWASESGVIGKDDVAAALANHAAVVKNLHRLELVICNAIRTAGLSVTHCDPYLVHL